MAAQKKDPKVRVAIIGCGGIANGKHMPSLSQLEAVEMVAFCDIDQARAEKAAKEYGAHDAKVYTDYRELLEDKSIDVVHVCTPNKSHADISVAALDSGKHVMCEKPMAKTAADARRMLEAARRSGKNLPLLIRIDSVLIRVLKAACRRGDLGKYILLRPTLFEKGCSHMGVFLNEEEQEEAPYRYWDHALDLTLWMIDNYKPKTVVGTTYRKLADQRNTANAWEIGILKGSP